MLNVENNLKYLISTEFLNSKILQSPSKQSNEYNSVVFECQVENLDKKIVEKLNELKNRTKDDLTLKIEILCGIYEIDEIIEKIKDFNSDFDYEKSKDEATSFILTLGGELSLKYQKNKIFYKEVEKLDKNKYLPIIDENFRFLDFSLSTAPWFVENFSKISKISMTDFDTFQNEIKDEISSFIIAYEERTVGEYFSKIFNSIKTKMKISELFKDKIQVKISLIKKDILQNNNSILNGFFMDDLNMILKFYENGGKDAILDDYLSSDEINKSKRIDLRNSDNLDKILPVFLDFPLGAFASQYSLMFSQQFAVNEILKRFKNGGAIYAINGPPGTGKTTLLKDIIACIVTKRAEILAQMNEDEIFNEKIENNEGKRFHALNPKLRNFEIVVGSSNNGAVENISKEIPKFDSIDGKYDVDYFSEFAAKLISERAWGLICATLGKRKNFNDFCNKFIWGSNNNSDEKNSNNGEKILGFYNFLKNYNGDCNFKKAKDEFNDAKNKVLNIQKNLKEKFDNMRKKEKEISKLKDENKEFERLNFNDLLKNLDKKNKNFEDTSKNLSKKKKNLENELINLQKPPFFFLQKLFSTKKYKNFIEKLGNLTAEISKISKSSDENSNCIKNIKDEIRLMEDKKEKFKEKVSKIENLKHELNKLQNFYNDNFEKNDENKREKSSPFMKDKNGNKTELFEARIDLFVKALNLHKEAILANRTKVSPLLYTISNINKSAFCGSQKVLAWKSLFFIIPVISSTFASFGRFFKDFGQDDIGYLLVDESGQAGLANTVGALFRSKKAVIVGDPLQLEPVVTLPKTINEVLMKNFNIKSDFNINSNSVQTRADRVEINGTYLGDGENKVWIGSPLRVHNRCNNPMFDISNVTTYDKMMIWGKNENKNSFPNEPIKSQFIDVKTNLENFNGNASQDEIKAVENLLKSDLKSIPKNNIKIISPFIDVVKSLKNSLKGFEENIGTIHTMQGKEAKIIVFVLGG